MFGGSKRRSRQQPYPQLTRGTANPNASTAATAAFMASTSQNPNRALSSAAAAAALRARPHTPTNVSEVQTKRTARRSPSVSSMGSAASAAARTTAQPRLERRGSSGSMSERSFRSPSPHGERRPNEQDHPPVPAIPPGHRATKSAGGARVGMQNFKTASEKMGSSLPSWYTQPHGDTSNVRTSDAPMRAGRPESISSVPQRPDSRSSSINFSYPARTRAQSPSSPVAGRNPDWGSSPLADSRRPNRSSMVSNSSDKSEQTLVYDPNSRRMVPKSGLEGISYQIKQTSDKPKKSKKSQASASRPGSHQDKGTVTRVTGMNFEPSGQAREKSRSEQIFLAQQQPTRGETQTTGASEIDAITTAPQTSQPVQKELEQGLSVDVQASSLSISSTTPEEPQRLANPRLSGQIARKPSVVKEESEEEEEEGEGEEVGPGFRPSEDGYNTLDNVPTRQTMYKFEGQEPPRKTEYESGGSARPYDETYSTNNALPTEQHVYAENKHIVLVANTESVPKRSVSQSPPRQARFAPALSEGLMVRHTPLPRSASPIKSALKQHSPSPRDASPSENLPSDASRVRASSPERDALLPRKKSVRVSFDERSPVVVGESHGTTGDTDLPVIPSPQARRPWYSAIARNKRKDSAVDEDEGMKPRPVLPTFGSVREKKVREYEEHERPLIRPYEPPSPHSPVAPTSSVERAYSPCQAATSELQMATAQSSDHMIGSVLAQAQDNASRNAANISRFREPLPPVVTSIEGNGDYSDSMKSSDDEAALSDDGANDSSDEVIPSTQTTAPTLTGSQPDSRNGSTISEETPPTVPEETKEQHADQNPPESIPAIAITQSSPPGTYEQYPMPRQHTREYFGIPGMFPADESDDPSISQQKPSMLASTPSSTAAALKEPEATISPSQAKVLPQTTLATTLQAAPPENMTDDESNASIYSDAYEDVSDMESEGFQSLDAVVESPVSKQPTLEQISEVTLNKQSSHRQETTPTKQNHNSTTPGFGLSQSETDWEQAKLFWRGLTADKRRQLELEAMEEAGADADHEELKTPTRKLSNRAKKSTEQRQATAVAVVQAAQAQSAKASSVTKPKQMKRIEPERVYMIQPGSKANHGPLSPAVPQQQQPGRMRMSMRHEQPQTVSSGVLGKNNSNEVHLRKSMRSGPEYNTASRRISQPPKRFESGAASTVRPHTASGTEEPSALHTRSASIDVAASAAAAFSQNSQPIAPQRRGSDASESSFKRARASASESFSFKRTMRQDATPSLGRHSPLEATKGSGRFSLRSLSPRRTSIVGPPPVTMGLRRTLRSGSDSSKDSKRASLGFGSFGRSSGKAGPRKIKLGSRLDNSSDEDEPVSTFRSRFDDSSDEDETKPSSSARPLAKGTMRAASTAPAALKKAATPVVEEDGDSPDLPDSDDDALSMQLPSPLRSPGNTAGSFRPDLTQRASSGIGTTTLGRRPQAGRGIITASPATPLASRPAHERRSSFMSTILRRNKKADSAGKIMRSELMDSAARRDTNLERSTNELRTLRGDSRPTSPRLQKRSAISRGDSWPLPEAPEDGRPSTADGRVNGAEIKRPDFAGRRSTSLGLPGVQPPNGYDTKNEMIIDSPDGTKKRKKFGALRRIFRLDD